MNQRHLYSPESVNIPLLGCLDNTLEGLFFNFSVMKTNVIMKRDMGQFIVNQRTKDGMFNATSLIKQWNKIPSNPKRDIKDFFKLKGTKEFIKILEEDLDGVNLPYVKSKASRGENFGTWMHPYLFIKYAMWLNPKFELSVIKFVYDNLIEFRHKAGDNYKLLSASASIFPDVNYQHIAKGLNYIVFGKHERDIRNSATPEQIKELHEIERQLAFSIDMGLIRTFGHLLQVMRKMYNDKNQKF